MHSARSQSTFYFSTGRLTALSENDAGMAPEPTAKYSAMLMQLRGMLFAGAQARAHTGRSV